MRILDLVPLGLLIGVLGLGWLAASKSAEEAELRAALAGWETCAADVASGSPVSVFQATCPAGITHAVETGRRSQRCNVALAAGNTSGARADCSTEVKALAAELFAASTRAQSLEGALNASRADQAAAVARAEARTRTETERRLRAQAAVDGAPRDADGLVVCDSDCLRARQNLDAAGARPPA